MKKLLLPLLLIAAISCKEKSLQIHQTTIPLPLYVVRGEDTVKYLPDNNGSVTVWGDNGGLYYGGHYDSALNVNILYFQSVIADSTFILKDNTIIIDSGSIQYNNTGSGSQTINNP